jgi:hypothetical protein
MHPRPAGRPRVDRWHQDVALLEQADGVAAVAGAGELQRQAAAADDAAGGSGRRDVEAALAFDGQRVEAVEGALGRLQIEAAEEVGGEDGGSRGRGRRAAAS